MDIEEAIEQVLEEYNLSGRVINRGYCEEFASRVIDIMGGYSHVLDIGADDMDVEPWVGHYWIEYEGRFFDAECIRGVDFWQDLPIFKRCASLTN